MTAVFLQVRPTADALYKSDIFPWSRFLTGKNGLAPQNNFDPLEFWIQEAHNRNLELHAWINPYRISGTSYDMEKLSPDNPARKMYEQNRNDIYFSTQGIYYNPASERVQKLILDGVREIVNKYNVDGIHIDDYFYPSTETVIDEDGAHVYITTNLRVLLENDSMDDLQYLCNPIEYHEKRISVRIICSRGVSHEAVRHRTMSFCQTSQRYVNYTLDKFGNEITFIIPE
jgi:uncharacterized lipoprotein YddW (UPF0748 family)